MKKGTTLDDEFWFLRRNFIILLCNCWNRAPEASKRQRIFARVLIFDQFFDQFFNMLAFASQMLALIFNFYARFARVLLIYARFARVYFNFYARFARVHYFYYVALASLVRC